MKPIRVPETNAVFNPAEGDEENVVPMFAEVREDEGIVSTWELTAQEREWIAEGGYVQLAVVAVNPPPVGMMVVGPSGMQWSDELKTFVCPTIEP